MIFTGLADEAGAPIKNQLAVIREFGWGHLELRNASVDGAKTVNVHDLPDEAIGRLVARVADVGLSVLHEDGMNYGELSAEHTLRLVEAVPGRRMIFDPGSTVCTDAGVLARGQVHTISIEPHIGGDPDRTGLTGSESARYKFIAYGRRLGALVAERRVA